VKPTDPVPGLPGPPSARKVFAPGRLELAERYAELLAGEGVIRGLIGPREGSRLWDRHLLNCAVLGELVPTDAEVCDVGSGAGLPGIVLAIARPDLSVTLVEPLLRRTTFLEEVVAELGLGGVDVCRARAEDLHGTRTFDVVTSRAVAPLERLLVWSMPLVAPTGSMVAMKGTSAADEVVAAESMLDGLGCAPAEVISVGANVTDSPTTAIRVAWADPARVRLPRPKASSKKKRRRRG
jgi:16S rRNA (guanine527-N7)-methyltransferase